MAKFELRAVPETGLPCIVAVGGDTSAVIARFTPYVPVSVVQRIVDHLNDLDDALENEQADTGQEGG